MGNERCIMNWQEMWEEFALLERNKYEAMETESLLADVSAGIWGNYYTIWYVTAEKASASEAAPVLLKVLRTDSDYLYRYHAASALLQLTGLHHFNAVDLSGDHPEMEANINEMESLLRAGGLLP
jgi:hypothetical protein